MSVSLNVAIFQGHAELGKKDSNIIKMKELMVEAKKKDADVLVFPELFTTGYFLPHDLMKELAEERSGHTFCELSQHSKDTGIAVLYGYPELDQTEKVYYNSAQFIDKQGQSLANYRKTHLWIDEEQFEAAYTSGSSLDVFEFCGFKIGILICFDAEFNEAVSNISMKGAKLILAPTASSRKFNLSPVVDFILPANCVTGCVSMAYVNSCDDKLCGNSRVYDHTGKTLLSLGTHEEGVFTVAIANHKESSYHLGSRRPELYENLISSDEILTLEFPVDL